MFHTASNILNSLNRNYLNYQSFFTCAPFVVYCNFFWNNCRHITSFSLNVSSFTVRRDTSFIFVFCKRLPTVTYIDSYSIVLNAWLQSYSLNFN